MALGIKKWPSGSQTAGRPSAASPQAGTKIMTAIAGRQIVTLVDLAWRLLVADMKESDIMGWIVIDRPKFFVTILQISRIVKD